MLRASEGNDVRPRRYLLLTHPRSASNLFCRMLLSQQDNAKHEEYAFGINIIHAWHQVRTKGWSGLSPDERKDLDTEYRISFSKLEKHFNATTEEVGDIPIRFMLDSQGMAAQARWLFQSFGLAV